MYEYLDAFLEFVDKGTYWKEDNDITNGQVINEWLSNNEQLLERLRGELGKGDL